MRLAAVVDAGYRALFSRRSDGGIDVRLQAETMAGPHDLAALSCSESAALAAGQPLSFDPSDCTLEYSTSGGLFPYLRSLTLRQDGQFTIVDSKLGDRLTTRVSGELTSRIAAFLKTVREQHTAPPPGADRMYSTLVVTSLGRKRSVRWRGGAPTADVVHATIPDYRGTYVITPATGEISFWPEGASEPRDFSGKGTFSMTDDTVMFHDIWFGTKQATHKPDICEMTFTRRPS